MAQDERTHPYRIIAPVGNPEQLTVLLAVAVPLARARRGTVVPLYVGRKEEPPPWLIIPTAIDDVVEPPEAIAGRDIGPAILDYIRRDEREPDLMLVHWKGEPSRGRYLLGPTLDPLIQNAPCDVAVVRAGESATEFAERMGDLRRVLVPSAGGPNAQMALELALELGPDVQVTALRVAERSLGPTAISAQLEILRSHLEPLDGHQERLQPRVVLASGIAEGIVEEAGREYDLVLVGATRESLVDRLLFGNLPQDLAARSPVPLIIVRRREPAPVEALRRVRWRLLRALPQLTVEERVRVYRQVRRSSRASVDFYFMMLAAAAISSLGLLLDNSAIVIGAMLIAPMMSALLGVSMSVVQGDRWTLRVALRSALLAILLVLGVSLAIGLAMPGRRITDEMLSRSSPNLLDLAVALGAGAAASYATSRREVASALAGVAVAVALVPPLATVGLALGAGNARATLGALLLFLTNLTAIVSAATLIFLWMGFHPERTEEARARTFRSGLVGTWGMLAVITVILGVLTYNSVRYTVFNNAVERTLDAEIAGLGDGVALVDWQVPEGSADGGPVELVVTVRAARPVGEGEATLLQERLSGALRRPVDLTLSTIPTTQVRPPTAR